MKIDVQEFRSASAAAVVADAVAEADFAEHDAAKRFWTECSDTHVGPPEYYELQSRVLRELVLPALGPLKTALDVGCGDGRFTDILGEAIESVTGIDISPALIAQAQARWNSRAALRGRPIFHVQDAEAPLPAGPFDLVSCMGVLSTFLEHERYLELTTQLARRVANGALLITKDTVSTGVETVRRGEGYSVRYRQWSAYRRNLEEAGFSLVTDIELARWSDELVNVLCVWRRHDDAPAGQTQSSVHAVALRPEPRGQTENATREVTAGASPATSHEQLSEQLTALARKLDDLVNRLEPTEKSSDSQALLLRLESLEGTLNSVARGSWSRGSRTPPLRVLFMIHHATAWPALRGVVDAMLQAADFEPIIMSLPHHFPLVNRMGGEREVHDMLARQGYRHIRVLDDDTAAALDYVKALSPHVVFRQAPWDGDIPPTLSAQNLAFTKLCYIPYGYMTARIEAHQFDQMYHRLCWRIFCPDEAHRQLFEAHNLFGDINCRVTGYPKFDHLLEEAAKGGDWPDNLGQRGAFRLLWAPHFSCEGDWLKFGAFDRMAGDMLALAMADPSLEIVLRPHPAMLEAMTRASSGTALGEFRETWRRLPNTALSTQAEYAGLFEASEALLTDGLSFFSEYQLFNKPLIFFERPDHVGFNRAGAKLVDGMYRVRDFGGLLGRLQMLRAGVEDREVSAARRRIAGDLRPFPGESTARILDIIRTELINA